MLWNGLRRQKPLFLSIEERADQFVFEREQYYVNQYLDQYNDHYIIDVELLTVDSFNRNTISLNRV